VCDVEQYSVRGNWKEKKARIFWSWGLRNLGHFMRCGQNWRCNWHQIGSYLGLQVHKPFVFFVDCIICC